MYKCLIANDEPLQLQIIQLMFELNDFETTTAQNGHEAYELAVNSFNEDQNGYNSNLFDIIVLDLNMPISDGFEACKNILKLYSDRGSKLLRLNKLNLGTVKESNSIECS